MAIAFRQRARNRQGRERPIAEKERIETGTETQNQQPFVRTAQKGNPSDTDVSQANLSAMGSELKKATTTQPEKEREEGRTHRKEAPESIARGAISPGMAALTPRGEGKAREIMGDLGYGV